LLEVGSTSVRIPGTSVLFCFSSTFSVSIFRAHEQYGYCQAGTNGFLTPDDDVALIGAPGPYTWRGTVYAYNISDNFLERDKTKYYVPVQEKESPVDKYSYLGEFLSPFPLSSPYIYPSLSFDVNLSSKFISTN
jgi:hypothetical protein